jgi:hypothetical protein
MAKITLNEAVYVSIQIDGEDLSGSYGPGDVEVHDTIATLLTNQGLVSDGSKPKSSPKVSTPTVETTTDTTISEA